MKLVDMHASGACGGYTPWRFESSLWHQVIMKDKQLAQEILQMAEHDQALRLQWQQRSKDPQWKKQIEDIDCNNTNKMKRIIAEYGWPTIGLVGKKASHAAWLLVQHADHDLEFQKRCLELMKQTNDVKADNIAFLTDRILVSSNKPQKYGTQFEKDKKHSEKWIPSPIEDVSIVDQLRKEAGMQSLQENIDEINKNHSYGTKASSL